MPRTYTPRFPTGTKRPKTGGRKKGAPNKSARAIREAVLHVFVDLRDISGGANARLPDRAPEYDGGPYYVLNERLEPVETSKWEWQAFLASEAATVAITHLGPMVTVKTIFTGVDVLDEPGEAPCLFETICITRGLLEDLKEHRTWAEAEEGHRNGVQKMRRWYFPASTA
jgi:hypothetical protein